MDMQNVIKLEEISEEEKLDILEVISISLILSLSKTSSQNLKNLEWTCEAKESNPGRQPVFLLLAQQTIEIWRCSSTFSFLPATSDSCQAIGTMT